MADDKINFEEERGLKITGGSARALKLGGCFANCVSALDAAVEDYGTYQARCVLSRAEPVPKAELENSARLMNYFTAMMMSGHSIQFARPGIAEMTLLLSQMSSKLEEQYPASPEEKPDPV